MGNKNVLFKDAAAHWESETYQDYANDGSSVQAKDSQGVTLKVVSNKMKVGSKRRQRNRLLISPAFSLLK